jgi:predicted dehydrogenase
MWRVAIVGAGAVGSKRALIVHQSAECILAIVADQDGSRAKEVASEFGAEATTDAMAAAASRNIDIVVVCTPTKFHPEASIMALQHGKHVLCEKPLARSVGEAEAMISAAESSRRILKTGFNYRHMAHVRKAKELLDTGVLGSVYFARCSYGHGGRPGYETSWCTDQDLSGGGALLEQGIHILDLFRYLVGEPSHVIAQCKTFFWNFPVVEDNCFLLLKSTREQIAQIHVSWTQWVNILSFEIFGREGYLHLSGRDGHYGPQRLTWGRRQNHHGRPEETHFDFPPPDDSWQQEWEEFLDAIRANRVPMGSAEDGLRALHLVEAAYQSAREREWVNVSQPAERLGASDDSD